MRAVLSILLWCVATSTGCATSDPSSKPTGVVSPTDTAADRVDHATCDAWLASEPYDASAPVCGGNIQRALEQLATDAPGRVVLSSARQALVWFPPDWASRDRPTILTLLHGSAGCPEAMFADARWAFGEEHALISIAHKTNTGDFLDEQTIGSDLEETLTAVASSCPTDEATHLLYGLSRGGYRAIQLGGLDRDGAQRFAGVVSDSGSVPSGVLDGPSYQGARVLLWCGEYDPDPVQEGRSTCDVMQSDMRPYLERAGAEVDTITGDAACHGIFGWNCPPDCSTCTGRTGDREAGPHAAEVATWLSDRARNR